MGKMHFIKIFPSWTPIKNRAIKYLNKIHKSLTGKVVTFVEVEQGSVDSRLLKSWSQEKRQGSQRANEFLNC